MKLPPFSFLLGLSIIATGSAAIVIDDATADAQVLADSDADTKKSKNLRHLAADIHFGPRARNLRGLRYDECMQACMAELSIYKTIPDLCRALGSTPGTKGSDCPPLVLCPRPIPGWDQCLKEFAKSPLDKSRGQACQNYYHCQTGQP